MEIPNDAAIVGRQADLLEEQLTHQDIRDWINSPVTRALKFRVQELARTTLDELHKSDPLNIPRYAGAVAYIEEIADAMNRIQIPAWLDEEEKEDDDEA